VRDWQAFVRAHLQLPDLAPEREARVVRELAAQLEDFYREALARGSGEEEADAWARGQIEDWTRLAQDVWRAAPHRHARAADDRPRRSLSGELRQDLRYGIRQLIRAPIFTLTAVVTLGLGVGATSSVFGVVSGVLLRPLPYRDAGRLVRVYEVQPEFERFSVAPATFLDWRQQSTAFESMAAYATDSMTYAGGDLPERLDTASVSWELFETLGVPPALGRGLAIGDDAPGRTPVVVLSHGAWVQRFEANPAAVGRTMTLNGTPATIVGVMPQDFYFPDRDVELWTPLGLNPADAPRGAHYLEVVARMKPDVNETQALTEIKTITERLARQYPEASANESATVVPLHEEVVGEVRRALLILFGAVGFVALIACTNVANLLLVRASARRREMAIRVALGAGRWHLWRQMLTESLVLAAAGAGLGLLLAQGAMTPIRTLGADTIPRVQDIAVDGRVVGFAAIVSLLTGALFGLVPAWQAWRTRPGGISNEGGRRSTGVGGGRLRAGLLVGQIALSIVLLVGAVLLVRSFGKVTDVEPGFDAEHVLAWRVSLPPPAYDRHSKRVAFYRALLARLESVPGVTSAGMSHALPMRGAYFLSFTIEGEPTSASGPGPGANYRTISAGYFRTLGIPLRRGRTFTPRDDVTAPGVAIVDEAFAERYFPATDPLGRRLRIGNGTDAAYEIVGIVGSVHHHGLDARAGATMYVPSEQDPFSTMWIVARTAGDPADLSTAARRLVSQLDPALPAYSMGPLADAVTESVAGRRFSMLLLTAFALVALLLAAVGLYGLVAYSVVQRRQEIGLRLAIGAGRGDVLRLIIADGLKLAAAGVALGIAGALGLANQLASMLYEVTPFDPASYLTTSLMLLCVAGVASWIPARYAARLDPLTALRQE
jgi:putative ABC transport system permease protein